MAPSRHTTPRGNENVRVGAARSRILAAGADQFAHYGFAKVTMDEIAHAAGMGKASIYYYFPTKDALFQAVVTREYDDFVLTMEGVLRTACSAADKLRAYQRHRLSYFTKLVELNILEMPPSLRAKPVLLDMFDEFARREMELLERVIREGTEGGEFKSGSSGETAMAFLHIIRGLRLCRVREARGKRISQEAMESLRQELAMVTEIFLRGIGSAEPLGKDRMQPRLVE